jgi:hypothetical protein
MWKVRLFALVLIAAGVGIVYMNWQEALTKGTYDLRMAAFGPLIVVGGIFIFFFPTKMGRPETTMDKIIVMLVFVIGLAAGFYNWYLMDPQRFDFILALLA